MLTRLYADNFGCFVNFEFQPAQRCLLIGDNGSGKTTLFDILWRVGRLARYGANVDEIFPAHDRTAWESRPDQTIELGVQIDGSSYAYTLQVAHQEAEGRLASQIRTESVTIDGDPLFRFSQGTVQLYKDDYTSGPTFPFSGRRSFLASLEPSTNNRRLVRLLEWLSQIWHFRLDPLRIRNGWIASAEDRFLSREGENFAAFYRFLVQENPEVTARLQGDLSSVIDGFQRLKLVALGERKGLVVEFSATSTSTTYQLPFAKLSDGQAVLIVLYTVLHAISGRSALLCMDEPDNFVALQEIQPWLQRLSDVHQAQALVISHHPEVIDYLAADSVFLFNRPNGGLARVRRLEFRQEGGLKASEQLARGWIESDDAA